MAKAVIDHLEAIEVDEQHCALAALRGFREQLVGLGTEMQPVRQGRDRVVHAQRLRILDRRPHLGEQSVDRRCQLGHVPPDDGRRWRDEVAILHGHQSFTKGGKRPGALAIRPFRRDVADQQAESARDDRCHDLVIEIREVEEGADREDERGQASRARKHGVTDLLGRAWLHSCGSSRGRPRAD